MTKTSFQTFISEDETSSSSQVDLFISYLEDKLGKIYRLATPEKFKNASGNGQGIRLFAGTRSFRLNLTGRQITSIDIWTGKTKHPNFHIDIAGFTKTLKLAIPKIIDLILHPKLGKHAITEAIIAKTILAEAAANPEEAFDKVYAYLQKKEEDQEEFVLGAINRLNMGARANQVFFAMLEVPGAIKETRSGAKTVYKVIDMKKIDKKKLLKDTFKVEIKSTITVSAGDAETLADPSTQSAPPPTYEQKLADLEEILVGVIKKNLSNGVFIGGRGGTGKTYTVEKVLEKLGLQDGKDYFKTTTTASPSAMYQTLFDHRDGVIVFDDADNALDDDEGRNLIKAATDTKKTRKLSWTKQSNWTYDPLKPPANIPSRAMWLANMTEKGMFPRSYEFTGKIIFISNKTLDKLDPDGALRTRAFVISLDPSNDEIISYMRKLAPKIKIDGGQLSDVERQEVVDEIAKDEDDISIRKLVRGLNIRAAGMSNWKVLIQHYA